MRKSHNYAITHNFTDNDRESVALQCSDCGRQTVMTSESFARYQKDTERTPGSYESCRALR